MSDRFAAGARRLSGFSTRLLGWRPDHFWSATPAELAAILSDPDADPQQGMDRETLNSLLERERHGQ